jgi:uracil phosphoribosyltransferase
MNSGQFAVKRSNSMKKMKRLISSVVAVCFIVNTAVSDCAFALSPAPGSTVAGTREAMLAAGQKLFGALRGPGSIDWEGVTPIFTGDVPNINGIRFVSPAGIPEGWEKNDLLKMDVSNLTEALKVFLNDEAHLGRATLEVEERYYEPEKAKDGELPLTRWEYNDRTQKWTLVVHPDLARMWQDLKANDVWFEMDLPGTGERSRSERRTVSLAWAIFYRIAKHEMADFAKYSHRPKSHGHMEFSPPHAAWSDILLINKDEIGANKIGGRYALVNDAIWMWFLGSYCFKKSTQYNNDTLRDRLLWFFGLYKGKDDAEMNRWAVEHNLPDEFPNLHDAKARDEAIRLAQAVNHRFYSNYKSTLKAMTPSERESRRLEYKKIRKSIVTVIPATGIGGDITPVEAKDERLKALLDAIIAHARAHQDTTPIFAEDLMRGRASYSLRTTGKPNVYTLVCSDGKMWTVTFNADESEVASIVFVRGPVFGPDAKSDEQSAEGAESGRPAATDGRNLPGALAKIRAAKPRITVIGSIVADIIVPLGKDSPYPAPSDPALVATGDKAFASLPKEATEKYLAGLSAGLREGLTVTYGGPAFASASVLKELGADVKLIGAVGDDDIGRGLIETMRKKGMDVAGIKIVRGVPTSTNLIFSNQDTGETSYNLLPGGANEYLYPTDINEADLRAAVVHLGGIALNPGLMKGVSTGIISRAKAAGALVGWDTVVDMYGMEKRALGDMAMADYLTPSIKEARAITGNDSFDANFSLFEALAPVVFLKSGESGSAISVRKSADRLARKKFNMPALRLEKGELVDTTGCGDSFSAYVAAGMAVGLEPEEIAKGASVAGACTAMRRGGGSLGEDPLGKFAEVYARYETQARADGDLLQGSGAAPEYDGLGLASSVGSMFAFGGIAASLGALTIGMNNPISAPAIAAGLMMSALAMSSSVSGLLRGGLGALLTEKTEIAVYGGSVRGLLKDMVKAGKELRLRRLAALASHEPFHILVKDEGLAYVGQFASIALLWYLAARYSDPASASVLYAVAATAFGIERFIRNAFERIAADERAKKDEASAESMPMNLRERVDDAARASMLRRIKELKGEMSLGGREGEAAVSKLRGIAANYQFTVMAARAYMAVLGADKDSPYVADKLAQLQGMYNGSRLGREIGQALAAYYSGISGRASQLRSEGTELSGVSEKRPDQRGARTKVDETSAEGGKPEAPGAAGDEGFVSSRVREFAQAKPEAPGAASMVVTAEELASFMLTNANDYKGLRASLALVTDFDLLDRAKYIAVKNSGDEPLEFLGPVNERLMRLYDEQHIWRRAGRAEPAERRTYLATRLTDVMPEPSSVPPEKRVVMLISGGEAAGVNNYFALTAKKLARLGYSVEVVKFGLDGLIKARAEFDGTRVWVDWATAEKIMDMPGAFEGTARVKLDDPKHPEYMATAIANLKDYCKTAIIIGGNDHIGEAHKVAEEAAKMGVNDMLVIALPKTLDRDTKVYPIGASSAAVNGRDFVRRAKARPGSGRCVVVQSMGRDMGYLTAASGDQNDPTVVVAVPERSYDPKTGKVYATLDDIVRAIRVRMEKYGAATIVLSEGFRIYAPEDGAEGYEEYMARNPVLRKVLGDPFLKAKLARILKDPKARDNQGNLRLGELGIADFVVKALELELGMARDGNLLVEDTGYSLRCRVPDELDRAIAESATDNIAGIVADAAARAGAIARGGVCIAADIATRDVSGAKTRVMDLRSATGKVDLEDSGIYSAAELRSMNIIGLDASAVNILPEIVKGAEAAAPGYNIDLAAEAVLSQSESARDMKRANICVIPRRDADEIIDALDKREPVSGAERYLAGRTKRATIFVTTAHVSTFGSLVKRVYATYEKHGFVNLVISAGFAISQEDPLLAEMKKDDVARSLIESIKPADGSRLVFGSRLGELISMALSSDSVLEYVRDGSIKSKKGMSGVRKNILGGALDLLPGEKGVAQADPSASTPEASNGRAFQRKAQTEEPRDGRTSHPAPEAPDGRASQRDAQAWREARAKADLSDEAPSGQLIQAKSDETSAEGGSSRGVDERIARLQRIRIEAQRVLDDTILYVKGLEPLIAATTPFVSLSTKELAQKLREIFEVGDNEIVAATGESIRLGMDFVSVADAKDLTSELESYRLSLIAALSASRSAEDFTSLDRKKYDAVSEMIRRGVLTGYDYIRSVNVELQRLYVEGKMAEKIAARTAGATAAAADEPAASPESRAVKEYVRDGMVTEFRDEVEPWLSEMRRDYLEHTNNTTPARFRELAYYACSAIAEKVSKTPGLDDAIVVLPWRAALAFASPFRQFFNRFGHLGVFRDEKTAEAHEYYASLKEVEADTGAKVIIADPMLATGGSFILSIERLLARGVKEENITVVSVISAPEGIVKIHAAYPKVRIITGQIDEKLDENHYIVPGLGDFGDRFFDGITAAELIDLVEQGVMSYKDYLALRKRMAHISAERAMKSGGSAALGEEEIVSVLEEALRYARWNAALACVEALLSMVENGAAAYARLPLIRSSLEAMGAAQSDSERALQHNRMSFPQHRLARLEGMRDEAERVEAERSRPVSADELVATARRALADDAAADELGRMIVRADHAALIKTAAALEEELSDERQAKLHAGGVEKMDELRKFTVVRMKIIEEVGESQAREERKAALAKKFGLADRQGKRDETSAESRGRSGKKAVRDDLPGHFRSLSGRLPAILGAEKTGRNSIVWVSTPEGVNIRNSIYMEGGSLHVGYYYDIYDQKQKHMWIEFSNDGTVVTWRDDFAEKAERRADGAGAENDTHEFKYDGPFPVRSFAVDRDHNLCAVADPEFVRAYVRAARAAEFRGIRVAGTIRFIPADNKKAVRRLRLISGPSDRSAAASLPGALTPAAAPKSDETSASGAAKAKLPTDDPWAKVWERGAEVGFMDLGTTLEALVASLARVANADQIRVWKVDRNGGQNSAFCARDYNIENKKAVLDRSGWVAQFGDMRSSLSLPAVPEIFRYRFVVRIDGGQSIFNATRKAVADASVPRTVSVIVEMRPASEPLAPETPQALSESSAIPTADELVRVAHALIASGRAEIASNPDVELAAFDAMLARVTGPDGEAIIRDAQLRPINDLEPWRTDRKVHYRIANIIADRYAARALSLRASPALRVAPAELADRRIERAVPPVRDLAGKAVARLRELGYNIDADLAVTPETQEPGSRINITVKSPSGDESKDLRLIIGKAEQSIEIMICERGTPPVQGFAVVRHRRFFLGSMAEPTLQMALADLQRFYKELNVPSESDKSAEALRGKHEMAKADETSASGEKRPPDGSGGPVFVANVTGPVSDRDLIENAMEVESSRLGSRSSSRSPGEDILAWEESGRPATTADAAVSDDGADWEERISLEEVAARLAVAGLTQDKLTEIGQLFIAGEAAPADYPAIAKVMSEYLDVQEPALGTYTGTIGSLLIYLAPMATDIAEGEALPAKQDEPSAGSGSSGEALSQDGGPGEADDDDAWLEAAANDADRRTIDRALHVLAYSSHIADLLADYGFFTVSDYILAQGEVNLRHPELLIDTSNMSMFGPSDAEYSSAAGELRLLESRGWIEAKNGEAGHYVLTEMAKRYCEEANSEFLGTIEALSGIAGVSMSSADQVSALMDRGEEGFRDLMLTVETAMAAIDTATSGKEGGRRDMGLRALLSIVERHPRSEEFEDYLESHLMPDAVVTLITQYGLTTLALSVLRADPMDSGASAANMDEGPMAAGLSEDGRTTNDDRRPTKTRPVSEIISEYFAPVASHQGPGRTEPTPTEIGAFYPVFDSIKHQTIEIYLPQTLKNALTQEVADEIRALNKRVIARTGRKDDMIVVKAYTADSLMRVLERVHGDEADTTKRIFVNDTTMTGAFGALTSLDRLYLLKGSRVITASVPKGRDRLEDSVRQAWLMKVSILSAIVNELNMSTVGSALRAELAGRLDAGIDVGDFVTRLVKTDKEDQGETANRIAYFLGAIVKLSTFIGEQIRILKAFWTAA